MVEVIFVMGLLSCLVCGLMVSGAKASGLHEVAWVIGGGIGGAMMIAATYLAQSGL